MQHTRDCHQDLVLSLKSIFSIARLNFLLFSLFFIGKTGTATGTDPSRFCKARLWAIGILPTWFGDHYTQCSGSVNKYDWFWKVLDARLGLFIPKSSIAGSETGTATGTAPKSRFAKPGRIRPGCRPSFGA